MKKAFEEIIKELEAKRELVEQALLPRVAKNAVQTAYSMAIKDVQSAAMKYEAETVMQVHITPEMREDMQECVKRSKIPGACSNCNRCSLNKTDYYGQAFCEVESIRDQILAGEEWINVDMGIRHNTGNLMVEYIGEWVPKEMCTINIQGEADDCLNCRDVCEQFSGQGCEECPVQKCFDRLAQYEASGAEPDQIKELSRLYGEKCKEVAELEKRIQDLTKVAVTNFAVAVLAEVAECAQQEDSPLYEGDKEVDCFVRLSNVNEAINKCLNEETDCN